MIKTELAKVAEALGLTYHAKDRVMLGKYKNYKVVARENLPERLYSVSFPIKTSDLTQTESMNAFIQELVLDKKKIKKVTYEGGGLRVDVIMKGMAKTNVSYLTELIDKIATFAARNYYETCCEMCGENKETEVHLINNKAVYVCETCYGQIIEGLDSLQENAKQRKGNFVTGIVGAFLGSLIGIALWVVVYALGYIAAICGVVLAVCIIKGYELFGGKLNVLGMIITITMTIAMVFVATYTAYGYELYSVLNEYESVGFIEAINGLKYFLMDYEDVRRSFIADLFLGYFFTAIGSISSFISAYRVSNFKYTAKKVNG